MNASSLDFGRKLLHVDITLMCAPSQDQIEHPEVEDSDEEGRRHVEHLDPPTREFAK